MFEKGQRWRRAVLASWRYSSSTSITLLYSLSAHNYVTLTSLSRDLIFSVSVGSRCTAEAGSDVSFSGRILPTYQSCLTRKKKGVRPDGMKSGQRKRTSNMGSGATKKSTEEFSLVVVFVLQTLSRDHDSGNGTLVACGVWAFIAWNPYWRSFFIFFLAYKSTATPSNYISECSLCAQQRTTRALKHLYSKAVAEGSEHSR